MGDLVYWNEAHLIPAAEIDNFAGHKLRATAVLTLDKPAGPDWIPFHIRATRKGLDVYGPSGYDGKK